MSTSGSWFMKRARSRENSTSANAVVVAILVRWLTTKPNMTTVAVISPNAPPTMTDRVTVHVRMRISDFENWEECSAKLGNC